MYHLHLFTDWNAKRTHNVDQYFNISWLDALWPHFLSFNPLWTQWPLWLHKWQQPWQNNPVMTIALANVYHSRILFNWTTFVELLQTVSKVNLWELLWQNLCMLDALSITQLTASNTDGRSKVELYTFETEFWQQRELSVLAELYTLCVLSNCFYFLHPSISVQSDYYLI